MGTEVRAILAQPDVRQRIQQMGFIPVGSSPEVFARFVADGRAEMGRVVREANIRLD